MLKLGLIGKDVSKSDSARMHTFIVRRMGEDCTYDLLSITPEELDATVKTLLSEYDAFNVTIPYKRDVFPYLKEIRGDAAVFGAVNTVTGGCGYNTDGLGFSLMLENNGVVPAGKKALVLGAGGAGRSVIRKLADAGADVYAYDVCGENLDRVYADFGCFTPVRVLSPADYDIVVNATGVGMHRSVGKSPVGADMLESAGTAVDLIYVPRQSEFLRIAASMGKKTVNGEGMLFYQAYFADCLYLGREPDAAEAKGLFEAYRAQGRETIQDGGIPAAR